MESTRFSLTLDIFKYFLNITLTITVWMLYFFFLTINKSVINIKTTPKLNFERVEE